MFLAVIWNWKVQVHFFKLAKLSVLSLLRHILMIYKVLYGNLTPIFCELLLHQGFSPFQHWSTYEYGVSLEIVHFQKNYFLFLYLIIIQKHFMRDSFLIHSKQNISQTSNQLLALFPLDFMSDWLKINRIFLKIFFLSRN